MLNISSKFALVFIYFRFLFVFLYKSWFYYTLLNLPVEVRIIYIPSRTRKVAQ